jgi:hypothetical protein
MGNILMGTSLIFLLSSHMYYGDSYILYMNVWQGSMVCKLISVLGHCACLFYVFADVIWNLFIVRNVIKIKLLTPTNKLSIGLGIGDLFLIGLTTCVESILIDDMSVKDMTFCFSPTLIRRNYKLYPFVIPFMLLVGSLCSMISQIAVIMYSMKTMKASSRTRYTPTEKENIVKAILHGVHFTTSWAPLSLVQLTLGLKTGGVPVWFDHYFLTVLTIHACLNNYVAFVWFPAIKLWVGQQK